MSAANGGRPRRREVEPLRIERLGTPGTGPVVALLGGVHGDEPEGIVATGILARALAARGRLRGEVRIVQVANPAAHAEGARAADGDDNLARVFPGSADGSPAERLARRITDEVIAGADLLIDLHSAGTHYRMPLFAGYDLAGPTAGAAHRAAVEFGAPLVWQHRGVAPGRSLTAAAELGVPSIYVESGGGGRLRRRDIDAYVEGTERVLAALGIVDPVPGIAGTTRFLTDGDGDVDSMLASAYDGYCISHVCPGADVTAGETVAEIVDRDGRVQQRIDADRDAVVMMIRSTAPVHAGDGIAMLAGVGT